MVPIKQVLLFAVVTIIDAQSGHAAEAESNVTAYQGHYLQYPQCSIPDCKPSMFEFCGVASIGKIFDEYLKVLGFKYDAKRSEGGNTKFKVALIDDKTNRYCYGIRIQRHLLSLMYSQNVEATGIAIDLLQLLEKTELHKVVYRHSFWPETYSMKSDKQRKKFLRQLPCDSRQQSDPWIFKNNEHRGTGIVFVHNANDIRRLLLTNDDLKYGLKHNDYRFFHDCSYRNGVRRFSVAEIKEFGFQNKDIDDIAHVVKGESLIAQRYISNTYLINGRKFGIRSFVVLLSLNPYIVLFSDGYISINAEQFDAVNIQKHNVLSNREVSSKSKKASELDWNWSFEQMDEHLQQDETVNFRMADIREKMMDAARSTFHAAMRTNGKFSKSTRKKLNKYLPIALSNKIIDKRDNNYVWLAMDYLLTDDGNVKLLEINLHPGTRFIPSYCSWYQVEGVEENESSWQCQMARNITHEIVNVTLSLALERQFGNYKLVNMREKLEQLLKFHKVLIYREI